MEDRPQHRLPAPADHIERALQRIRDSGGSLRDLDDDSLAHLPVTFLTHWAAREVPHVYSRLPLHIQKLQSIQELLPCLEHYNKGRTHIDGPPPAKRNCYGCRRL
ncbi:hypothetical protein R5R35_014086 [Gryllus longicercus]|uniref:Uncharacterized protein n=1 Tax=Gryllus longicercus TaxID=2509291 RepID=A0AAN9W2F9_9ORTH